MDKSTLKKKMLEAKDYKLIDYYNSTNKIIIPLYQRGYSWEDKNMEIFIKDIYNNSNYYIGNIMVIPKEGDIDLIDGQQRLISSFIILCCLKNKFNLDCDFSFLDKGKKIEIETRAPTDDSRLLEFIYNDDIAQKYCFRNEVKEYKKAYKTIIDNDLNPIQLYNKLLNVIIVEIKFTEKETDAHNMFVNLNTKGRSLENVDILKSQLFKYLSSDEIYGMDFYKEGWYETINAVTEKNAQRYFDNFSDIFLENNKNSKIDNTINFINNLAKAKEYYDNFCYGSEQLNGLCKCATSVYNYSTSNLNDIYGGNISLTALDNYLKLLEKAKFKQFDVVLIPLIHVRNSKEKAKFINSYDYILKFIKFVLMHQEIMAINKASPSQYGNDFKKAGRKLFLEKNYKKIINDFLTENFSIHSRDHIINSIKKLEITHNNTKHVKQIVMLIEETINIDMTVEHFIPLDLNNKMTLEIGNCIPVKIDIYKTLSVDEKLERYKQNISTEPFIKKFLDLGFSSDNYKEKIEYRTSKISEEYADIYKKLFDDLRKI